MSSDGEERRREDRTSEGGRRTMTRDVAQRERDQAGHRIVNLGEPKESKDATRTDNESTPKASSGSGSPGKSLLAAPADHVHPASPGGGGGAASVVVDDPSMQSLENAASVIWETAVDLSDFPGRKLSCSLAGIVQAIRGRGKFTLKMGGDIGQGDGTTVASFESSDSGGELKRAQGEVDKPDERTVLFKVMAEADDSKVRISGKSITIRSV